jgi:hypothetical protein
MKFYSRLQSVATADSRIKATSDFFIPRISLRKPEKQNDSRINHLHGLAITAISHSRLRIQEDMTQELRVLGVVGIP